MTREQHMLAEIDAMTGGIPFKAHYGDKTSPRSAISQAELRAKFLRLYRAGLSWNDLYATLPTSKHRVNDVYNMLLREGQITARPRGNHKKRV
jgi:hypothetical protein